MLVGMPETRWLNPDEMRAWLAFIGATTLLDDFLDQQLRRDAGVTHADYFLLAYLSSLPDRALGMTQLAEALRFTRSRLTRAVARLEQAGLVRQVGRTSGGKGASAVLYDLDPRAGWVLGIDVGRSWVRCAVTDITGRTAARRDERALRKQQRESERKRAAAAKRAARYRDRTGH
jgi:hypothetical protein